MFVAVVAVVLWLFFELTIGPNLIDSGPSGLITFGVISVAFVFALVNGIILLFKKGNTHEV